MVTRLRKSTAVRRKKPLESSEQTVLVARIRQFWPSVIVFAVPNGGRRGKREATRLVAEGVLKGVPDLVVAEARGGHFGLFIEMKRTGARVSALSKEQRDLRDRLTLCGYRVEMGFGAEDAYKKFEAYMSMPRTIDLQLLA